MKFFQDKSVIISLSISVFIAGLVMLGWLFGGQIYSAAIELTVPKQESFQWWNAAMLVIAGLTVGYLTEHCSIKRVLPYTLGFLGVWLLASIAAAQFLNIGLLFVPLCFVLLTTILMVHLKKLWVIDSILTEKLVGLASTGHLLEGKSVDLRIESGLKLLETILPFSEAIVFRRTIKNELDPVGRTRTDNKTDCPVARQSIWRENIGLCEQALEQRKTVVQADENNKDAARIALPLIYEDATIGVLFVKVNYNFERADLNLLEAFSEQLARDFQRRELGDRILPHESWWSFFSTYSAENRLDIISLIHAIIKEQSFSAIASSYLKESHAVAYLDGTLAFVNRQMRHLANLTTEEFYQTDIFGLLERFKTEVFVEPRLAIRRVLQTGDTYKSELYFPENNKTLDMQISLVKIPSDNQSIHDTNIPTKPACFLITFRDISAVKENAKLRSDMTSLMSHELRTPITSISGFAELLLADENMPEDAQEFLTIISNESQRLSKMLSTFLSVANLEQSDKQEFTKTTVKLDSVVKEVVNDLQENAKRKRIRLVEDSNNHIPPVAADRGLIARAISHLIDNAIRYSPEKTSVMISTILESDFLRVVVEDRGYGIHPSEHEKIWQKFYRVSREGFDKEEESTGLGLSLVKEIVEQHGGAVTVESDVGAGSKFSFTLPRL